MSLDDDDWNNRIKAVVVGLAGKIPHVGGIVATLLGAFWPTHSTSIWDLIEEQVEELVNIKILERELEERQNDLNAIHRDMESYVKAQNVKEKMIKLEILVSSNLALQEHLLNSSNRLHFIPLVVASSTMHLTVLLERYTHGAEFFGEQDDHWEYELIDNFERYVSYFNTVFPDWCRWRKDQIHVEMGSVSCGLLLWCAYGEVTDSLTGEKVGRFEHQVNQMPEYWYWATTHNKERMFNSAKADMLVNCISSSFYLVNFLPGEHDAEPRAHGPDVGEYELGPFCHKEEYNNSYSLTWDAPGLVDEVFVRAGVWIDWLQLFYEGGRKGKGVGKQDGGNPNSFYLDSEKWVNGVDIYLSKERNVMNGICLYFSDDTDSGLLGNSSGECWDLSDQKEYMLSSVFQQTNPYAIKFRFSFRTFFDDPDAFDWDYFSYDRPFRAAIASANDRSVRLAFDDKSKSMQYVHDLLRGGHEFIFDPVGPDVWAIGNKNDEFLHIDPSNPSHISLQKREPYLGDHHNQPPMPESGQFFIQKVGRSVRIAPKLAPSSFLGFHLPPVAKEEKPEIKQQKREVKQRKKKERKQKEVQQEVKQEDETKKQEVQHEAKVVVTLETKQKEKQKVKHGKVKEAVRRKANRRWKGKNTLGGKGVDEVKEETQSKQLEFRLEFLYS